MLLLLIEECLKKQLCGIEQDLCRLVCHSWSTAITSHRTDPDIILDIAGLHGNPELCRFAKECGATNFNKMLIKATEMGNESLCRLAIEFGATNVNDMLIRATLKGNESLCRLAKELGATNFDKPFIPAVSYIFHSETI